MARKNGNLPKRGRGRPRNDEQLQLLDVGPANLKKIAPLARQYNQIMHERCELLTQEVELKKKILELVHKEKLSRLPDGAIRFECEGTMIEVVPTDEVIRIKEKKAAKRSTPKKGMAKTVAATQGEA